MSNNKEIICKLIKAKNQEANSYTDQTCYNAAYCNGYVDGATMALNTLSGGFTSICVRTHRRPF